MSLTTHLRLFLPLRIAPSAFTLLGWHHVLKAVRRAHESLPGLTKVGWDVAITDQGVTIIEANTAWHPGMIQVAHRRPIADPTFIDWAARVALRPSTARRPRRWHGPGYHRGGTP